MMKLSHIHRLGTLVLAIFVVALLWKLQVQQRELSNLRISHVNVHSNEAHRTNSQGIDAKPDVVMPAPGSPGEEQIQRAFEECMANAAILFNYLRAHPELRIPQMDLIGEKEWMRIAVEGNFKSEADVRRALGKLRGIARQMVAPTVGKALAQAMDANNGRIPENIEALVPYFPADFNLSILQGLEYNPGGKISGLASNDRYILVDKPVDIWDSTLFYNKSGEWGVKSSSVKGESNVSKAVDAYTHQYGSPPSDASQLLQYPGVSGIDAETLKKVFAALMKSPAPTAPQ